jgi:mono/diheme cytochrome c family protein
MRLSYLVASTLLIASLAFSLSPATAAAEGQLSYNRDIRPILSANCYQCHGPDKKHRKADLRLDEEDGITEVFGETALADNEAWQRLISKDPKKRMPPPTAHITVKPEELEKLKTWIAQGANFQGHWAFVTPTKPALPTVKQQAWVKNPIDAFILARLEAKGLAPNNEAVRERLLRRVTFDL